MTKKILSLTILVLLTSSCSLYHIDSSYTTDDYFPPESKGEVVYLESIDQPHVVIGTVTVNAERRQRLTDVIEKMKHEAGVLGGNAITDVRSDATGLWKRLPAQHTIGNAYVRANFTATVVILE